MPVTLAEQKRFGNKALTTQLGQPCSSSLKALLRDLKGVEKAIKQLIANDPKIAPPRQPGSNWLRLYLVFVKSWPRN